MTDTISAASVLRRQAQQKRAHAATLRAMADQMEQSATAMERIAEMVGRDEQPD